MEETPNQGPEAAETNDVAPEAPRLWDLTEEGDRLVAKDPAGWWDAVVVGGNVSITRYANHSLLNRPAGMIDSADQTIAAPLGELIDRLIELDEPYSPGPAEMELGVGGSTVKVELSPEIQKALDEHASTLQRAADALHAAEADRDEARNELASVRQALGLEDDESAVEEIAASDSRREWLETRLGEIYGALGIEEANDPLVAIGALKAKAETAPILSDAPEVDPAPQIVLVAEFAVPGLPHQAIESLKSAGLWSAEGLKSKTDEELVALPGVGEASVAKIRAFLGAAEAPAGA